MDQSVIQGRRLNTIAPKWIDIGLELDSFYLALAHQSRAIPGKMFQITDSRLARWCWIEIGFLTLNLFLDVCFWKMLDLPSGAEALVLSSFPCDNFRMLGSHFLESRSTRLQPGNSPNQHQGSSCSTAGWSTSQKQEGAGSNRTKFWAFLRGLHSTEVAFAPLTQRSWVQFLAF